MPWTFILLVFIFQEAEIISIIHSKLPWHYPVLSVCTCSIVPVLCALRTEIAAPPHSLPQSRLPPTLGVLEANTRYTPSDTAGFSAVRKGKSTWTVRSEEQAGSRVWDSRRQIEGALWCVRRHRDTIFCFPPSRLSDNSSTRHQRSCLSGPRSHSLTLWLL